VILNALGLPVSPATALLIEAFGTGVRFASFMVPAHLGALEGGHVAIFVALGMTAPAGLTFSLVRRVREAAWTTVGLIALTALGMPSPAVAAALAREA
jgi:glycosyltransferase 2 family protein